MTPAIDIVSFTIKTKYGKYQYRFREWGAESWGFWVASIASDLDEYSPLDNNEDMEKISSDLGKYTYKYINSFDNYLSTTPLRVFMKEYKQGHLIYLIIKTRFKNLLLDNKELIQEYIQWNQKSSNDLESEK